VSFGPGGGTDTSAAVSIAKDSVVRQATLHVEGVGDTFGRYPYDVEVFAHSTSNATKIYQFSGTGYGAMGRQTRLASGAGEVLHRFASPGSATDEVLLPKGASIVAASLTLVGGGLHQGFTGPDFLNHRVGSNFVQLDTGQRASPHLVDIDGDGDLDLFAAGTNFSFGQGYQGGPRFYRNVGNATSYEFVEQMSLMAGVTQGYGTAPALADLDSDGDFDLLVVGGLFSGGAYNMSYYRNAGNATVPQWARDTSTFAGLTTDGVAHAAFGDINGDTLIDLVVGDTYGGLTTYLNSGNATSPQWTASNLLASIDVGGFSAPALGDINGDGDLDLVVGNGSISGQGGNGPAGLVLYEQTVSDSGQVVFVRRNLLNQLNVGPPHTATIVAPFLGDLDGDGDLDIQLGDVSGQHWRYTANFGLPSDVVLDVGADGTPDGSWSGTFGGPTAATGLGPAFFAALNGTTANPDDSWGNAMAPVPVAISTATTGVIQVQELSILYDYAPATKDFTSTLERLRQGSVPDATGKVSLAIPVAAQSAGVVRLSSLSVVLDLAPVGTVPANVSLPEDTKADSLLDLGTVFLDDFTPATGLLFEVVANTQQGVVEAYITSGRWLGVDASTGVANDHWNGQLNVTVRATDGSGLSAAVTIPVVVTPVNDPPQLSGVLSNYTLNEDVPWELIPHGADVDGDPLAWSIVGLPTGATFDAGSGVLRWTPRQFDVGVHSFTVRLSDGVLEAQAATVVTVLNVNDPPVLRVVPNQTATEGVVLTFDLSPYCSDEDDPLGSLTLTMDAAHGRLSGKVASFIFPAGSGIGVEKVRVTLVDPHGAVAEASFAVLVLPAGPSLALVGVPDLQVVEGVPKTIDVSPYLYNVENVSNLTLSASSVQVTASGTRLTFLYPVGFPLDSERVTLRAAEGDEAASWQVLVTIVRVGSLLLLADLPDLDVAEGAETVLDLGPYLHNVDPGQDLLLTADSPHARFEGTRLILLYLPAAGVSLEVVSIRADQGGVQSTDSMVVTVHPVEQQFFLDPLPQVHAIEGTPLMVPLGPFVHNADDLGAVSLTVASAYATVSGLTVTFLYPTGSGVGGEQVTVVARFGSQSFSAVLSVTVTPRGASFALAGVPDLVVFAGAPYAIPLGPYLHNLGTHALREVRVVTDSPYAHVEDGPKLVLNYPESTTITGQDVTLTATLEGQTSQQTLRVTVRKAGAGLAIAPIPTQFVREDEPLTLDVFPFLLHAPPGPIAVQTDSAHVTVSDVTWLTLAFPGGTGSASFLVTVVAGGQTAQAVVAVLVEEVNDPPFYIGGPLLVEGLAGDVKVWDLAAMFGDEEDAAGLVFSASDPRVVIDPVARTATLVLPPSGEVRFSFTATDAAAPELVATSPEVTARATASFSTSRAQPAASGDNVLLLALFVALGAGAALAQRRDGGRALGARGGRPTLTRRPR
jgi:hypothetical protein